MFFPHQDPLVITACIADFEIKRVLVVGGSSADLLFADAFDQMMIPRDRLSPPGIPLVGFAGRPVTALGHIDLAVESDDFGSGREIILECDGEIDLSECGDGPPCEAH